MPIANREIPRNMTMHVSPYLVVKFLTDACGATLEPYFRKAGEQVDRSRVSANLFGLSANFLA